MKLILILTIFIVISDTFSLKLIFPMREKTKYVFRNSNGDRMIVIDTVLRNFPTKLIITEVK